MQLSLESVDPVRMRRINSAWLLRTLGHNIERNVLLVSAEESAERILEGMAERDYRLLLFNDYTVSRDNLKPKFSEQDVIVEMMKAPSK